MSSYFELHTLNLNHRENDTATIATNNNISEKNNITKLKEKIFHADKNQKQKTKLFKIKLLLLLFLSHSFIYLLATTQQNNQISPTEENKNRAPTLPGPDEVVLSISLVYLSNFQKNENSKWIDIYSPSGELYAKNISLLKNDSDNAIQENTNPNDSKFFNVIVKKSQVEKILLIANKNYHALPEGIFISSQKTTKRKFKTITKNRDPFQKPWSSK